jgi:hypothetical protein
MVATTQIPLLVEANYGVDFKNSFSMKTVEVVGHPQAELL